MAKAWIWYLLAVVFGLFFSGLVVQHLSGVLDSREIEFGNRSKAKAGERYAVSRRHFAGLIPDKYRCDLVSRRAVVLENGVPLLHRETSLRGIDEGAGRFAFTLKYAHFKPSDGSDPNTNGRRYTLEVPRMIKPSLLWAAFTAGVSCLFLAFRCRSGPGMPAMVGRLGGHAPARPWLEVALVALLSVTGGVFALWTHVDSSNGGLCVMGKPYSDAIGWHEVAVYLSEGLGFHGAFSDNRPFYAVFQAIIFLVAGDSIAVAQATNVFLLALGAFFVYFAARRLFGRPAAIAAFAFVLLSREYWVLAPSLLTELPAYAMGAVGIFLLAEACRPGDSRYRGWILLAAGIFLACSNLARPLTLVALPFLALAVLHAGIVSRWGWRKTFLRGCILGVGILLVTFPWALRQKRVNDIWSISINSSELLYGAAMPGGRGRWNSGEFDEAAAAGVDLGDRRAKERFFSRRYDEVVRADPSGYFRRMGANYVDYFRHFSLEQSTVETVLALTVLFVLGAAALSTGSVLPVLGFPLFWLLGSWADGWRGYELIPGALVILLLAGGKGARSGIVIAAVILFFSGVLSALVGNFGLDRGLPVIAWLFVALVAAAAVVLARAWSFATAKLAATCSRRVTEGFPLLPPCDGGHSRAPLAIAIALLGLLAAGGLGLIGRTLTAGEAASRVMVIDDAMRADAMAATREAVPAFGNATSDQIYCEVVLVCDFRWIIPGGYDVGHWSRLFEIRPEDRTTAYLFSGGRRHPGADQIGTHFRGRLDAIDPRAPYVVVGLRNAVTNAPLNHDALVIEGLALVPYDEDAGALRLEAASFFPPGREARALLGGKTGE